MVTRKFDGPKVLNNLVNKQHHIHENRASKAAVANETSFKVSAVVTDDDDDDDDDTAHCDDNEID